MALNPSGTLNHAKALNQRTIQLRQCPRKGGRIVIVFNLLSPDAWHIHQTKKTPSTILALEATLGSFVRDYRNSPEVRSSLA